MKHIIIIILFIVTWTACEDQLDQAPISSPSAANFYRDTEDFEQAVTGIYNSLNDYSNLQFYLSEVRSDNVYSPGTGVREWNPVNNFDNTLSTNSLMASAWDGSYRGIFLANTVLDKINPDVVPDETIRNRMIGEAKFIRALYYFDLVRYFGKAPLYETVISPSSALEVPRAEVSEVYNLIINDLEDAIQKLPASYAASGKATSMAARGLLARVYMTKSGPTYSIDGPGLESGEYNQALTLLDEIINSNAFGLEDDYTDIFAYGNENNDEIIFAVQAINDGATGDRGIGTILPTLMYHESFAKINLPFAGGVPGDSPINPSDDLLDSYEEEDSRDETTVLMSYVDENGNTNVNPQFVKFLSLDPQFIPADRFNWGIDFPVIRYTDIVLMKAEALIQTGGDQSEIDRLVNSIRERAGVPPVTNVNLDILLEERRKEFAAEGLRWHDLVRTGQVLEVMNAWKNKDDTSDKIPGIEANDIIYPIHQSQLEVKEGLYNQNPGY
ncbi:RagB/SusD family nutrient uptake outer membrane protein [Membranihabitans maritimus]|uniref:RagB/SusD family nutrient uptake outer membrane protein n=1 Tax=Membranihabitans maritimus TaxID=2904244 RepID=UPI001F3B6C63|nr:RagB/SusD family nutrient uptake outer membrane protein [Membranihabitans maritimus]